MYFIVRHSSTDGGYVNTNVGDSYDWTHFVGIRNGTNILVYVNGSYVEQPTTNIGAWNPWGTSLKIALSYLKKKIELLVFK
ncbi:hypothetical protein ES703_110114 [subsurface metagenome]